MEKAEVVPILTFLAQDDPSYKTARLSLLRPIGPEYLASKRLQLSSIDQDSELPVPSGVCFAEAKKIFLLRNKDKKLLGEIKAGRLREATGLEEMRR